MARPNHEITGQERPTLRSLADHLGLSPTTVSVVISHSPAAQAIPASTRKRILAAAQLFNYRPNYFARSLSRKRSMSVGILVAELSEGYFTLVINGVADELLLNKYFYFIATHTWKKDLLKEYPRMLIDRSVDGLLLVNTPLPEGISVPIVSISGHDHASNVTTIELDHTKAAVMALTHLIGLGHRRIAFMKGQRHTPDTEIRWRCIMKAARDFGIVVHPSLCIRLEKNDWSPDLGYGPMSELLSRTRDFTALFSFNDTAAIGAIRAMHEVGMAVPYDVSVIGFDDILCASFGIPSLSTVRQPLGKMGQLGARILMERINEPNKRHPEIVVMEPELIVRESTGAARTPAHRNRKVDRVATFS